MEDGEITDIKMDCPDHVYVVLTKDLKSHSGTKEIYPSVFADFDPDGNCIGIEFTEAARVRISKVE